MSTAQSGLSSLSSAKRTGHYTSTLLNGTDLRIVALEMIEAWGGVIAKHKNGVYRSGRSQG
jgi:hypothetical protein